MSLKEEWFYKLMSSLYLLLSTVISNLRRSRTRRNRLRRLRKRQP